MQPVWVREANRQIATPKKAPVGDDALQPVEWVATPGVTTLDRLAAFLRLPRTQLAKTLCMVATIPKGGKVIEKLVVAVARGDMEVNETKLANALHATELRPAQEREMKAVGLEPGYASPVGLSGVTTIVDDLIPTSRNLVGANEVGFHLRNVNLGGIFTQISCEISSSRRKPEIHA